MCSVVETFAHALSAHSYLSYYSVLVVKEGRCTSIAQLFHFLMSFLKGQLTTGATHEYINPPQSRVCLV
jgi:hypothetical protein